MMAESFCTVVPRWLYKGRFLVTRVPGCVACNYRAEFGHLGSFSPVVGAEEDDGINRT